MFQGVKLCTTLRYVSGIGVTAFMWSKFDGENVKISRTYDDHICQKKSLHLCPVS